MKDKISKHLKKRFPLCDDAYFDKVAGEITEMARDAISEHAMVVSMNWAGIKQMSMYQHRCVLVPFLDDPLARVDQYFEDDQGIVDTVIIQ